MLFTSRHPLYDNPNILDEGLPLLLPSWDKLYDLLAFLYRSSSEGTSGSLQQIVVVPDANLAAPSDLDIAITVAVLKL